jgi:DNA mismatch repair protein MutS
MTFHSILFARAEDRRRAETQEMPDFFVDLNLDQVIGAIVAGRQEYDLKPFFYTSLHDLDAITYRHEIMRDLEQKDLLASLQTFAESMKKMRKYLVQAGKMYYEHQKERWFLDAVAVYCDAVTALAHDLDQVGIHSRGFLALRDYVRNYTSSGAFPSLLAETNQLKADLSQVRYCILIKGNSIRVRAYEDELDYSAQVEAAFAKFQQGAVKDYRAKFPDYPDMNHVEAQILTLVARLYPALFSRLDAYCAKNTQYLDKTIATFDRDIQFYLAYLEYIAVIQQAGMPFCYPQLSETSKEVSAREGFDIALAYKLVNEHVLVVCNDFFLKGQERIIVVTGPNQGGKTTFARTFGQMHFLASLGCPVPGREVHLFLFDRLLTHFEREEHIENLRGKLQDDLVRMHEMLQQATPRSILLMNEIFTSTALHDALFLSKKIMELILPLDLLCVWITFIDELASYSEKTVSMTSTVVPGNPAVRTFKIVRMPADGRAHAVAIAEKHRLTYEEIKERLHV